MLFKYFLTIWDLNIQQKCASKLCTTEVFKLGQRVKTSDVNLEILSGYETTVVLGFIIPTTSKKWHPYAKLPNFI